MDQKKKNWPRYLNAKKKKQCPPKKKKIRPPPFSGGGVQIFSGWGVKYSHLKNGADPHLILPGAEILNNARRK